MSILAHLLASSGLADRWEAFFPPTSVVESLKASSAQRTDLDAEPGPCSLNISPLKHRANECISL